MKLSISFKIALMLGVLTSTVISAPSLSTPTQSTDSAVSLGETSDEINRPNRKLNDDQSILKYLQYNPWPLSPTNPHGSKRSSHSSRVPVNPPADAPSNGRISSLGSSPETLNPSLKRVPSVGTIKKAEIPQDKTRSVAKFKSIHRRKESEEINKTTVLVAPPEPALVPNLQLMASTVSSLGGDPRTVSVGTPSISSRQQVLSPAHSTYGIHSTTSGNQPAVGSRSKLSLAMPRLSHETKDPPSPASADSSWSKISSQGPVTQNSVLVSSPTDYSTASAISHTGSQLDQSWVKLPETKDQKAPETKPNPVPQRKALQKDPGWQQYNQQQLSLVRWGKPLVRNTKATRRAKSPT